MDMVRMQDVEPVNPMWVSTNCRVASVMNELCNSVEWKFPLARVLKARDYCLKNRAQPLRAEENKNVFTQKVLNHWRVSHTV